TEVAQAMPLTVRSILASVFWLTLMGTGLHGQGIPESDPAPELPPRPRPQPEADRHEARQQYARGILCERRQRLLEALECWEAAARLDPDAVPPRKALVPLYLALERHADALAATRRILELDPDDYETWYLYARQLQVQGNQPEALAALARAVACPAM